MRVAGVVALLVLALTPSARAQRVAPTNLLAVDEFIDAPRALFGRTRPMVECALGKPTAVQPRSLPGAGRASHDAIDELAYPGVVIGVSRTSTGLRRVEISEPRWPLPRGLNVGVARSRVEELLGEPQAETDLSALYLYSDAYPDTVEFYFRAGRVHRIEWLYAPVE
jgi:hypothetical protein